MIEIRYNNDYSFEINFVLRDYIPQKYFEIKEDGTGAELYFYIDLFKNCKHFHIIECELVIWEVKFLCYYKEIKFEMYYDKDWNLINFTVDEIKHRNYIAEKIKELVEMKRLGS